MAGFDILRLVADQIDHEGGEDVIFSRLLDGETVSEVAATYDVSRHTLYKWRDLDETGERKRRWEAAIEGSADALVDKAQLLMDDDDRGPTLPGEARYRKDRADFFLRLAAVRNRRKYGKEAAKINVNTQVNTGDVYLKALKETGRKELPAGEGGDASDAGNLPRPSDVATAAPSAEETDPPDDAAETDFEIVDADQADEAEGGDPSEPAEEDPDWTDALDELL